jgi:hypothetical protein
MIKPKRNHSLPADLAALAEVAVIASPKNGGQELPPEKKKRKQEDGEENQSRAARAVELATGCAELWKDPDGKVYLDTKGEHGGRMTLALTSARSWLSGILYRAEGVALSGQAAADAIATLEAIATLGGVTREIYTRLARHEGDIYLDLGDESWQAVRIYPGGWKVVTEPPVRFARPRGLRPLPMPTREGSGWEAFRRIMHEPGERSFILLVAWLVGCLGRGPYPILTLAGEHGTGKTTQGRILRSLLDPSKALLRSPPRKEEDLVISASNSHIVGFDNLSTIEPWLSDALCRVATGGGFATRKLYHNEEEVIFDFRRPILLTSIGSVAERADLADRTIPVRLPVIPEDAKREEREIFEAAELATPEILGALLDAAGTGLERLGKVTLSRKPRMMDFAAWVVACEPALPWAEGRFLDVYMDAREDLVDESIEADPIARAIIDLIEKQPRQIWEGFTEDLYSELLAVAKHSEPPPGWPKTSRGLPSRIERALPLIRSRGIEQFLSKDGTTKKTVRTFKKGNFEPKTPGNTPGHPGKKNQHPGKKTSNDAISGVSGVSGAFPRYPKSF